MNETRQTEIINEEIKTSDGVEEVESTNLEKIQKNETQADTEETVTQENTEIEIDPRVEKRDQFFEEIKNVLLEQDRLLKKFFAHSDEHCEFDYEEMGLSFEEEEEHLKRTNKLKDKILNTLEENTETECSNRTIDTLHNMIICDAPYQEEKFRVVIEVFEDSFDLEII